MNKRANQTWQGLAVLAVLALLWWLTGKPELHVSLGEPTPGVKVMQAGTAPQGVPVQVAIDELVEPIDPQPMFVKPLGVELIGPRDVRVGNAVDLFAQIDGAVTDIQWSIQPPVEGLRHDSGDKKHAWFSTSEVGDYLVICSVAGQGGQSAHTSKVFTILPPPPEAPITSANINQPIPVIDFADLLRRLAADVPSANKKAEAQVVADTFRQSAELMAGGVIAEDPLRAVEEALEIAMGPSNAALWFDHYFTPLRPFLAKTQAEGTLRTPVDYINTWRNFGAIMDAVAASEE